MIGEMKNESFIPAHDLAMSVKLNKSFWPCYDASWDDAIAFLRLEDLRIPDMPVGRILICYREVPLGFVNNLGKRTNNGYPQSWRIQDGKKRFICSSTLIIYCLTKLHKRATVVVLDKLYPTFIHNIF